MFIFELTVEHDLNQTVCQFYRTFHHQNTLPVDEDRLLMDASPPLASIITQVNQSGEQIIATRSPDYHKGKARLILT